MTTRGYGSGIAMPIDAGSGGAPQYVAEDTRNAFAVVMLATSGRPLGGRSGIRPGNDPALSVDASGNWSAQPFAAYVDPLTASGVGAYFVAFQAATAGTVDPADGTFTRIDRLDIQVPDDPAGASPLYAQLFYTAGVPASVPVAPALAPRSTPFATITVPATPGHGSPSIASAWRYTVASGGVVPCMSTSDRPSATYRGLHIDDPTLGLLRWDGTKWAHPKGDTGWVASGIATKVGTGTITSQSARKQGSIVQVNISGTTPAASSGGTTNGDYGNLQVATLTSAWIPQQPAALNSAGSGPHFGLVLDTAGGLSIVNGPTAGFANGSSWSAAGMYYVD